MNIFKRHDNVPETYEHISPIRIEKPQPPDDFENLPDLRRGCESIKYNFHTFEYNYFPKGQLRYIAAKFAAAFATLAGFGLLLFLGIKILQVVLGPLPGIIVTAIISLVACMVLALLAMNFLRIIRFVSGIIAGMIGS